MLYNEQLVHNLVVHGSQSQVVTGLAVQLGIISCVRIILSRLSREFREFRDEILTRVSLSLSLIQCVWPLLPTARVMPFNGTACIHYKRASRSLVLSLERRLVLYCSRGTYSPLLY